jgi:hypothetical protein
MKYGVVLPIWQLTIAEAETLAVRAEELLTFDLPRAGVPAMTRAIERLSREVKPAVDRR